MPGRPDLFLKGMAKHSSPVAGLAPSQALPQSRPASSAAGAITVFVDARWAGQNPIRHWPLHGLSDKRPVIRELPSGTARLAHTQGCVGKRKISRFDP